MGDSIRPLSGVVIVEATGERGASCGRFLQELGAEVWRLRPRDTARRASALPGTADAHAEEFTLPVDLDRADDRDQIRALLCDASIFIVGSDFEAMEAAGLSPASLGTEFPHLVTMTISEFGRSLPRRNWRATDPIHLAMSGFLSRSGLPERPPIIPPDGMAQEAAGVQAAWAALTAYWRHLHGGPGDHIDVSIFDCTVQSLDPHFGASGSAANAAGAAATRGRTEAPYYPTIAARDGHVRYVCIGPRQWQALFDWMGQPEEFADPRYSSTAVRFAEASRIKAAVSAFFRSFTVAELLAEGQARGLPIAPVLSVAEVVATDHYRLRNALIEGQTGCGRPALVPSGCLEIDGHRATPRHIGAPSRPRPRVPQTRFAGQDTTRQALPLAGLRVLDLGVIVMGGEAARLFADQGADVVKIESRAFPDGSRGDFDAAITPSFAVGHRNLRSVGLDLRHPRGRELFLDLVRKADVLLNNFKPGTMEKLSLGYDTLQKINPALVMASCSAFGDTGPWRDWMGYGPLVRAATGLTGLWRYADDASGFGDSGLTYPDHFVARIVDLAVLACLIRRERSGRGGHVRCSQAEAVLMVLREHLAATQLGHTVQPPDAPWGLFPCAGDDEWCVVTICDDADWRRLGIAVGDIAFTDQPHLQTADQRREHRAAIEAWLGAWTERLAPMDAATRLQAAGVPAGPLQRGAELLQDPQLGTRRQLRVMNQPGLAASLHVDNGPALYRSGTVPPDRPAPLAGEHTQEVCAEWLGLGAAELADLLTCGALQRSARCRP